MKKINSLCLCVSVFTLIFLYSCAKNNASTDNGQSVEMRYSSLLSIHQCDGYITAEIKNPWDSTKVLHRYILIDKDKDISSLPFGGAGGGPIPEGDIVRTPVSHAVFYTSVHVSLVNQLGGYNSIAGVCDREYMYLDSIQRDVKAGKIVDCGKGVNPDIEKIIDLSPDAILLSPFENSGTYGKLGSLGIPIIECADYMETSPLGRAEWMRFYGLLVGHQHEADSLFADVEKKYNALKTSINHKLHPELSRRASSINHNPTVLADMKFGSSWYVAGANSTVGRLFADAGADYIFKDEKASGSVPYDPEVVFDRGQQADFWLIKYNQDYDMTYDQIAKEWGNYTQLKAFQQHNVYACNLSKVPFYEETPFHPDLLLRDYIIIFHPTCPESIEGIKDRNLRYFKRLLH